ncbi:amidohydrolase [Natronorubrum sp. FCH18a]|uniref:amidohydrolase n=1 Tax=Natronorubrum sp. FCH18a TaxID=3447018 RepID=UPI003F518A47
MATLSVTDGDVLLPDLTTTRADVLIDRDDGTILEIGPDLEGDETLDASNALVTPGFVNGHCHTPMTLLRGFADDKPLDRWLEEDVWPAESEFTAADVRAGAELGVLELIRSGVTGFVDMYFYVPEIADVVDRAGVRALLGHGIVTVGKDEAAARADAEESLAFAREYDGAAGGRISTAFMPHSLVTVGEAYLEEFVPKARAAGLPIHYHANETRNEVAPIVDDYGVRPLEYAAERGLLEPEDFVAHGVHVDEREIALLAEAGTSVIHCPASNMKLASGMAPIQRMLEAGVSIGLGTDGAAANNDLSMLDEARDAAMIGKLAAADASAVSAETVVELLTRGGAKALGFDSGRLEAGAPADIAVVDLERAHLTPSHDPVSHLAYAATAADVRHTLCNGRVLVRDHDVRALDESAVLDRAERAAERITDRANT